MSQSSSANTAIDKPWKDAEAAPFIRVKNVTKTFGDVYAVDNVSLDIFKSELFCLLGGSGSGKTTLLRMLAGFETPTEGTIEIDGIDMAHVPPHERPTNMMFQSYALFPHMSVEKNIAYGLLRDGVSKAETADRVQDMLHLVQLSGYGKRKPDQLSGGQRQRVALARSLVKRPKLLLLDEPLGALDKKLRAETQFELIQIQETLGVTFVVVTHDQEEAMTLASRIGVMNEGQIAQIGEPVEIYEFPSSRFVADFIGNVNMFEGRVVDDDLNFVRIKSDDIDLTIHVGHGVSCAPNQQMWFAIRPEKIEISREKPDQSENVLKGIVHEIAYLGNLSIYQIKLPTGKIVQVSQANLIRNNEDPITWDEEVFLHWKDTAGVVLAK